jgi:hypothetical protein
VDLDGDRYSWREIAANGETLDAGSGQCVGPIVGVSRRKASPK